MQGWRSAKRPTSVLVDWRRHRPFTTADSGAVLDAALNARAKGLAFEAHVEQLMGSLGCQLTPTQVSMDGGIDHFGRWTLPDVVVDVVTQCKNELKPVGVNHLRAFHGVHSLHSPHALGMFFSSSGYSIYAQRFFMRITQPGVLCTLDGSDRLTGFHLNDRARALLPKLCVGTSFVNGQHELILTYDDRILS